MSDKLAKAINNVKQKNKIADYILSNVPFNNKRTSIYSLCILLLWLIIDILICCFHEPWCDEVRALSIAIRPNHLLELPMYLKNEGHPLLWYLILRWGYQITGSYKILFGASVSIAFIAVCIFYRYAPFKIWQKLLFLFSVLPIYTYSVYSRPYGLSMLFLFLFAAFYGQRKNSPFILAFSLFCLANTNIHSCIFVCILTAIWFVEYLFVDKLKPDFKKHTQTILSFFIIGCGILISILIILPTSNNAVMNPITLNVPILFNKFCSALVSLGAHFRRVLPGPSQATDNVFFILLIIGLLIRPLRALTVFAAAVSLSLFFDLFYPARFYHEGLFILFVITIYWIAYSEIHDKEISGYKRYLYQTFKFVFYFVLPIVFIFQISLANEVVCKDLRYDMTSNKALGKFLVTSPSYQNAVIAGEPGYLLESLPYYSKNPIYLPREDCFSNYTSNTYSSKKTLTLGELLQCAIKIKQNGKKTVLIAIVPFNLSVQQGNLHVIPYAFSEKFTWSNKEMEDFKNSTVKLKEFTSAITDENYILYLVK